MDVISYNQVEIDLKVSGKIFKGYELVYQKINFDKNPQLTRYISKLSDQYNKYKEIFIFPTKYKGRTDFKKQIFILLNLEFNFASKLHYVKISFNTPKFEKITNDRAAKFVDMLSAIGGTMGLLTGFSIISGVEILYFAFKIALDFFAKKGIKLQI